MEGKLRQSLLPTRRMPFLPHWTILFRVKRSKRRNRSPVATTESYCFSSRFTQKAHYARNKENHCVLLQRGTHLQLSPEKKISPKKSREQRGGMRIPELCLHNSAVGHTLKLHKTPSSGNKRNERTNENPRPPSSERFSLLTETMERKPNQTDWMSDPTTPARVSLRPFII